MVNATLRGPTPAGPLSWNAYWLRGIGLQGARYVTLPLRLMLACTFLVHGLPKLGASGHAMFADHLAQMGFGASQFWAWLVGIVEVAGGVMLLFGIASGVAAIVLIVEMIVAMVTVHAKNGFDFTKNGVEIPLLIVAALLAVLIAGAGAFSVDEGWSDHDARSVRTTPPGP